MKTSKAVSERSDVDYHSRYPRLQLMFKRRRQQDQLQKEFVPSKKRGAAPRH